MMRIRHRITFSDKDGVDSDLDGSGISYRKWPLPGGHYSITLDVDECNQHWPELAQLVRSTGAADIVWTIFTKRELLKAEWLRLVPVFERGYPQPEETWVSGPVNHEDHCGECGTFRQVSSFSLKSEPNLGKNDFLSLFWTYALFCTPRVVSELEANQIRGYEVWDAIIEKTGTASRKASQLFVPHIARPGLRRVEDLRRVTCSVCGVTKYYPHVSGKMHLDRDALTPGLDIMQSFEWFGSGHGAYREILISNRLGRRVIEKGWKGVALKVVELV